MALTKPFDPTQPETLQLAAGFDVRRTTGGMLLVNGTAAAIAIPGDQALCPT